MPIETVRQKALADIAKCGLNAVNNTVEATPIELFGENVFSLAAMRSSLPKQAYQHMQEIMDKGTPLDPASADVIASAMKDWAISHGATHYCHWFHPLTDLTAEKHLSFLIPTGEGGVITEFSGSNLLQGEPDASSFPSGGIRSTFEARGYTGWDPTSNAFLMEGRNGKTLCIPSVFIGFGGHALDKKTPLLRSVESLSAQALRILRLFGNTQAKRVITNVGPEQEYFLIDRKYYLNRPDLVAAGRTLFGARPPKGQEMEDHYFGAIKERVLAYMVDLERELYKLGIPVTTRHNEVAPSQYEIAPLYERANIATDHNMLTMSVMKSEAHKHGFECLLHEKPFAGVNGSGKHNNWSIADDAGNNLLDPGKTPAENAQFLVFLSAVIRAVHLYGDLLRASIATPANDHRLGANEAPPAIISVYLGDKLMEVVDAIIKGSTAQSKPTGYLDIGVATLPPLPLHDSDRNRTSPFAFTGNKFEFRAVGSSQSVARPNMVINSIVADSLSYIADEIEKRIQGDNFNEAVREVVQTTLKEHQAIIFNGDNYSAVWHHEAEKRGLPNLKSFIEAYPVFISEKAQRVFSEQKVLNKEELESRYLIGLEYFIKTINIEAALTSNIGRTMILPAALEYQTKVATSISAAKALLVHDKLSEQNKLLTEINEAINRFVVLLNELDRTRHKAEESETDLLAKATFYQRNVRHVMDETRTAADMLELMVEDSLWPLPKYREMLFLV